MEQQALCQNEDVRRRPGGGSGGGMDDGNSVAVPRPINVGPGLNAIWVFGENMQAACGLNHQLAVGSNQQICINPAGLMAGLGVSGGPLLTGMLGGGSGGNLQLTFGSSAAFTMGQAFEINLGPEKIEIDGSFKSHAAALTLCGTLGVLAVLYAIGYGLKSADEDYSACGTYTLIYQVAVDVLLDAIMMYETTHRKLDEASAFTMNTMFGVDPAGDAPDAASGGFGAAAATFGASAALTAEIMVPLLLAAKNNRIDKENKDQDTANNPPPASVSTVPRGGGSGGGDGDKSDTTVGTYVMTANRIEFITRVPQAADLTDLTKAVATSITLLATGGTPTGAGSGGMVELRGNQGVRVTAGGPRPEFPLLAASSSGTNGIELMSAPLTTVTIAQGIGFMVGDARQILLADTDITIDGGMVGNITLKQGAPPADTSITMTPSGVAITSGTAVALKATTGITLTATTNVAIKATAGITVDAGQGSLTLTAAGGAASITLSESGIVIKGKMIELN